MRRFTWAFVVVALALTAALSVGVATATAAKGGNSANAKQCYKGGWMNLVRSDSTAFNNQDECVSYAAKGGVLMPKPTCTAGSDDFSDDAEGSQPTTWNGGTIEGPYTDAGITPGVRIQGSSWNGAFASDTHVLYTGAAADTPFRLTFTLPVSSIQLDVEADIGMPQTATVTLNAYDSSNVLINTDSQSQSGVVVSTLKIISATNNIKYFTVETSAPIGEGFSNIKWGCA